jgi:hypothetical protein
MRSTGRANRGTEKVASKICPDSGHGVAADQEKQWADDRAVSTTNRALSGDGGAVAINGDETWLGRRVNSTWKAQYEGGAAVFGSCGAPRQHATDCRQLPSHRPIHVPCVVQRRRDRTTFGDGIA